MVPCVPLCEVTLREPGEPWASGLEWGMESAEQRARAIGVGEGLLLAARDPVFLPVPPSTARWVPSHLTSEFSLVFKSIPGC